jgi:hypothetical protein
VLRKIPQGFFRHLLTPLEKKTKQEWQEGAEKSYLYFSSWSGKPFCLYRDKNIYKK